MLAITTFPTRLSELCYCFSNPNPVVFELLNILTHVCVCVSDAGRRKGRIRWQHPLPHPAHPDTGASAPPPRPHSVKQTLLWLQPTPLQRPSVQPSCACWSMLSEVYGVYFRKWKRIQWIPQQCSPTVLEAKCIHFIPRFCTILPQWEIERVN